MYEQFTDRAKKVLQDTITTAVRRNHTEAGTDYLLLNIVRLGEGVGFTVLQKYTINFGRVQNEVYRQSIPGDTDITQASFSQRSKDALKKAEEIATQMGNARVCTEHLLLAICEDKESLAIQILLRLGVPLGDLKNQLRSYATA